MAPSRTRVFYCVSTHWDREWYEPFQEFRMWLVEVIDELLDLLETNPDFRHFHLDGQAVVIEDYLAIRPERRERLHRLMAEGRLHVGPWYVLPDEWLVSGESLVRNLQMGMRLCRAHGVEPMSFGYTPDQFGHIAAMPMILAGFGLKGGIVWRGTTDEDYPPQFLWVGPDGSRLPTHKLFDGAAYGWHFYKVRHIQKVTDFADPVFQEAMDRYIDHERRRIPIPAMLILDGNDHQHAGAHMVDLFKGMQERYPDLEFTWATLEDYAEEMARHVQDLPERKGELRQPTLDAHRGCQYMIAHPVSSRYPLKQRNDRCQARLEKWAEPYALFQALDGGEPILRYLDVAWEYLIKNHPHDSICGCSIDQVHRDMVYRFDQCDQIADGVIRRAVAHIGSASAEKEHLSNVVVHNPLPFPRSGVVEVPVRLPSDWPKHYIDSLSSGEPLKKFVLLDREGRRLPFQMLQIDRDRTYKRLAANGRNATASDDTYRVAVELDLPACGYTGFRVEPTDEATRNFGSLRTGPLSAANEHLSFELKVDGTGRLEHKASGRSFTGLFLYEDCGDAGDGWTFGPIVDDRVVKTAGSRVTTSIESDGPLRTTFRVDREIDLPRGLVPREWVRDEDTRTLRIVDRITVEKGRPGLRVRTRVENPCGDHRLRVLFPTGIAADRSFADTPFAVVERDVAAPPESAVWHERANRELAFTSFFGVGDDAGGLAVLAPFGLHEYEATQTPERSLALTLFRATGQTVMTAGEPDGQLLGTLDFEYTLYPFAGAFDPVEALRLVTEDQAPVYAHGAAELPEDRSFLRLERNAAVVTAIKPAATDPGTPCREGIIRLWNPTQEPVEDVVYPAVPVKDVYYAGLDETPTEAIALRGDGGIPVRVPAGGLATIRFAWE